MKARFRHHSLCIVIGLIVIVLAVFFIGMSASGYITGRRPALVNKTEINTKTIEESIRAISELTTLSYNYTDVGEFSDQKIVSWIGPDFSLPFGQKSFIIAYDGEMKIGIDMSLVSLDITGNTIVIDIPPAHIVSHVIKEDSVRLFDEKSGWFNPISITDYTDFIAGRKQATEEKAETDGLLDQAQKNAETQLEAFILSFPGISGEYEIKYK